MPSRPTPQDSLNHPVDHGEAAHSTRFALRLDELASALGISRRSIERECSAGRFPKPDLTVGKMPLWKPETIRAWVEGGGR